MKTLIVFLLVFVACASASDPKKNPPTVSGAPIPEKVLSAKTVYLLVATRKQEYNYKNAYKYLAEWDRWKVVEDPKEADIVLRITDGADGSVGFGSGSATTAGGYTSGTGMMMGIPLHHFFLAVLASDGSLLWGTDTNERLAQSQNTQRMLKQLRARIAEVEKAKTAAEKEKK
jgi:hypothetical protein